VLAADGTVLHDDQVETAYAPWPEMVRYGTGVQPPSNEQAACLLDGVVAPEAPTAVATAQVPGASTALVLSPCNPTPEPTLEATPESTVEATPESTVEVTPEPTPQPTPPIWVEH
jgi:hypothetical protein